VDVVFVARQLRHISPATTLTVYAHPFDSAANIGGVGGTGLRTSSATSPASRAESRWPTRSQRDDRVGRAEGVRNRSRPVTAFWLSSSLDLFGVAARMPGPYRRGQLGWVIGWISATLARSLYPAPKKMLLAGPTSEPKD